MVLSCGNGRLGGWTKNFVPQIWKQVLNCVLHDRPVVKEFRQRELTCCQWLYTELKYICIFIKIRDFIPLTQWNYCLKGFSLQSTCSQKISIQIVTVFADSRYSESWSHQVLRTNHSRRTFPHHCVRLWMFKLHGYRFPWPSFPPPLATAPSLASLGFFLCKPVFQN